MSVPNPVTSRRTALGGVLAGLVALTGCDTDSDPDEPAAPQTAAPAVDADAVLVEEVETSIGETLATVESVRRARSRLRPRLRPLIDMHGAHLGALGLEAERVVSSVVEVGTEDLEFVRRAETRLQRKLTEAAVRAESGALAKLLASMAAAIAQHLADLP